MKLYPLKFEPIDKDYPWGNIRMPVLFGREMPEGIYAESWEVSTHPDGKSVVVNGELAGKPLSGAVAKGTSVLIPAALDAHEIRTIISLQILKTSIPTKVLSGL